jgi:hypothetical protein
VTDQEQLYLKRITLLVHKLRKHPELSTCDLRIFFSNRLKTSQVWPLPGEATSLIRISDLPQLDETQSSEEKKKP